MQTRRQNWVLLVLIGVLSGSLISLFQPTGPAATQVAQSLTSPTLDRIRQNGVLRVGAVLAYPPGVYKDAKTGAPKGFNPAVASLMANRLKVKLEIIDTPHAGLIPGLQAGKFDILLTDLTPKPERALAVTFARPTTLFIIHLLVPAERACGKLTDWNRKAIKMAVVQGTYVQSVADSYFPDTQKVILDDPADALLQLQDRRVNAIPNTNLVSQYWIRAHPEAKLKLCFAEGGGLGASTGAPVVPYGDLVFKEWVNVFFDDLINTGTYAKIYREEMGGEPNIELLREFR